MCGICGFAGRHKVSLDELKKMNDTMYHRGPDDNGAELLDMKNGVTL
ncbi:MAG: asparagine synthetase B, partial [Lachnospiraceae bacterium]|nr:asparagine synthetase B [Lachnospiraceae bacterium]